MFSETFLVATTEYAYTKPEAKVQQNFATLKSQNPALILFNVSNNDDIQTTNAKRPQ